MTGARAVSVRITGRVQGVGFREWTRREAERLELAGWVRNEADGSVVALLAGSESALATMLESLHRGPVLSRVTSVASEAADPVEPMSGFRIVG